jgi:regulator of nonsense transcripts 2
LSTFADAAAAVDTLLAEQSARGDTAEDSEDESDDEEEGERGAGHVKDEEDDVSLSCIIDVAHRCELTWQNAHPVSIESDSEEAEDDVVVLREKPPVHDSEDEDARMDFDREFAKMLADTTDAKRGERKPAPIFDTAVPLIKRPVAVGSVDMGSRSRSGGDPGHANASAGREKTQSASTVMAEQMQFSLMSKKGNKQQVRLNYRCLWWVRRAGC